jgi:hypothetical protein
MTAAPRRGWLVIALGGRRLEVGSRGAQLTDRGLSAHQDANLKSG